jgi:hypothetical protein
MLSCLVSTLIYFVISCKGSTNIYVMCVLPNILRLCLCNLFYFIRPIILMFVKNAFCLSQLFIFVQTITFCLPEYFICINLHFICPIGCVVILVLKKENY